MTFNFSYPSPFLNESHRCELRSFREKTTNTENRRWDIFVPLYTLNVADYYTLLEAFIVVCCYNADVKQ